MVGGQESARSTLHLAELFRLADKAGLLAIRSSRRGGCRHCARHARHRGLMRDFSRRSSLAVAQHRDRPQAGRSPAHRRGLRAARHPRHRSLARPGRQPSGSTARCARCATPGSNCPAIAAAACSRPTPRIATTARDDNRRAVDEAAALGAPCLVLVVGGLPQYSRPGSARLEGYRGGARAGARTASPSCWTMRGRPACRSRSSRCIRCMPPTAPASTRRAGARYLRRARSATQRHARRRGRRLSHLVGSGAVWRRSPAPGKDRLLAFHVCDWLVPTKDMLNDRGMMGDGVIDIKSVRAAVEAQGFAGYSEIEIFSSDWWAGRWTRCCATCIERHRTVV